MAAEAAACGTPVVAFRRGGLREVVRPSTGVLVAPDDVAALAAAVPRAVGMDRAAVRRSVLADLSVRGALTGYERVYGEALARHGRRANPLRAVAQA